MNVSPFVQGILLTLFVVGLLWSLWRLKNESYFSRNGSDRNQGAVSSRLRRYWHSLSIRKGVLLGYVVVIGAVVLSFLELTGTIDTIPVNGNSELLRVAQVLGALGTVALTLGLILLYDRQARISEQQYQPYLIAEVESRNTVLSQFVVRNTGEDYAYNIEAEWAIAGETRVWETQSLAPGGSATFPVIVDENGRPILGTEQVRRHIENNNASSEIEYEIRCEDQFGIPRLFDGKVDFDVMAKREESNEIWETDPMNSLASSMSNIESSFDQLASDINDRRDEQEWQDRWGKHQALIRIVEEREEIPVEVLRRMVRENQYDIQYRLSELEEAGYLSYDKKQGTVKAAPSPGNNHSLSDFT